MHLTSTNPETVYRAIDQCAETGYEMIILSFGSGLNAEDISDANIAKYKSIRGLCPQQRHRNGMLFPACQPLDK